MTRLKLTILSTVAVMAAAVAILVCLPPQRAEANPTHWSFLDFWADPNSAFQRDYRNHYANDNREVFRIIEVIEHDSFSIFPFMFDWNTRDRTRNAAREYNLNLPIGYEGLIEAQKNLHFSGFIAPPATSNNNAGNYYTYSDGLIPIGPTLPSYDVNLLQSGQWLGVTHGSITRTTENTFYENVSGYFEYVGRAAPVSWANNHIPYMGLYYLSFAYAANSNTANLPTGRVGINHETRVVPRAAGSPATGVYYVEAPAFYLANEPTPPADLYGLTYNGTNILSRTAFNYHMPFVRENSTSGGAYVADLTRIGTGQGTTCDYILVVANPSTWTAGFVFHASGNYLVASVTTNTSGDYVRIEDPSRDDGYTGTVTDGVNEFNPGYFILYSDDYASHTRYNVTFNHAVDTDSTTPLPSGGKYHARTPGGSGSTPADNWAEAQGTTTPAFHFIHQGVPGGGVYDIIFRWENTPANNTARYQPNEERMSVSRGQGRYALTSTTRMGNSGIIPNYVSGTDDFPKDYDNIILNFDFVDGAINRNSAATNRSNYGDNPTWGYGVSLGWNNLPANTAAANVPWLESGGWVFHQITDPTEMEETQLSKVHDIHATTAVKNSWANPTPNASSFSQSNHNSNARYATTPMTAPQRGDRIYVTNQTIRRRTYNQLSFVNNERFKLLSFATHAMLNPPGEIVPYGVQVNGRGYNFNQSAHWNLNNETTKALLETIDKSTRFEITQKRYSALTPEDVRSADIIYIGASIPVNGLDAQWNTISQERVRRGQLPLRPLPSNLATLRPTAGTRDLRNDTFFALYHEAIFEQNTVLIMDRGAAAGGYDLASNVGKLYFLMNFFDEPVNFAYFMQDTYTLDMVNNNPHRTDRRFNNPANVGGSYGLQAQNGDFPAARHAALTRIRNNPRVDAHTSGFSMGTWSTPGFNHSFPASGTTPNTGNRTTWDAAFFRLGNHQPLFAFNDNQNTYVNVYREGRTIFVADYWAPQGLLDTGMNTAGRFALWELLRNRRSSTESYQLLLEITNGEQISGGTNDTWVIYANEFDANSFDIIASVSAFSSTGVTLPTTTTMTFARADGSGIVAPSPFAAVPIEEERDVNVRSQFVNPVSGILDGTPDRLLYTVTAISPSGIEVTADVWVVVRLGFSLM
ncbi:MAG: hypothetical protein LBC96_06670 [Lachnospiraceae bacterium]|nr:hypothetical protein [Lachnospiraceae bacterium]